MNADDVKNMDRFEIYDSKKSLYERGIRYIEEGNVNEGIQTLELLLKADPEHQAAKRKLAEIYNQKLVTLKRKKGRRAKEESPDAAIPAEMDYRLRNPTELERGEIEFYLSMDQDALLIMIGQSSTGALGAEYSPGTAKKKGTEWLERARKQLRRKICDEWSYCDRRNEGRLKDDVILATAIGARLITIARKIPPLAIACLLIKMGLDEFCECKKA